MQIGKVFTCNYLKELSMYLQFLVLSVIRYPKRKVYCSYLEDVSTRIPLGIEKLEDKVLLVTST